MKTRYYATYDFYEITKIIMKATSNDIVHTV